VLQDGDQIGAYVIRRRLGTGGMGEVYLAEHRHIDRKAAIKVLLPELSLKEDVVARFFTEARAASRIRHPGIVEILDCDVDRTTGRTYIVMEYLEGESLGACLARIGRFEPRSTLAIVGQVAGALAEAHGKGIIHRDLKPDNVFLVSTSNPEAPINVKVLDFGIAKLASEGSNATGQTRTGSLLGTPLYMSPEQCRGAGHIDHRSDIYSLGCMTYQLLAGSPPFVREGAGELIFAHIAEDVPDLSLLVTSIPPELGILVNAMLEKEPDRRPQSMTDVVREIERISGTGAARFPTMIMPPNGFATAWPSGTGSGIPPRRPNTDSRSPSHGPLAGGTKLLPPTQTTLSKTASELAAPNTISRPAGKRFLKVGVAVAVLTSGALAILALGPSFSRTKQPTEVTGAKTPTAAVEQQLPEATARPRNITIELQNGPPVTAEANVASASAQIAASATTVPNRKTSHRNVDKAKPPLDATSAQKVVALILLGDTYVRIGDADQDSRKKADAYHGAIAQYEDALKVNPGAQSALAGRELVRKRLSRIATAARSPSPNDLPIPSD
jgi:serine/threonine protein kinase